jgi:ribonuclease HII
LSGRSAAFRNARADATRCIHSRKNDGTRALGAEKPFARDAQAVPRQNPLATAQAMKRMSAIGPVETPSLPHLDDVAGLDRFAFERALLARGFRRVAGVDEAGRGPLAGPVVAVAVILPARWVQDGLPAELCGLNDSKQLTAGRRERFFKFLTSCPEVAFAIASVDAAEIDALNILRATERAMQQALAQLQPPPEHVLLDGRAVRTLQLPQTALVRGDARSYSIAAASVLAKIARDRMMLDFHERWPMYGFAEHKGYGTAAHLAALAAHGPCPIHRRSFAPVQATRG